MLRRHLTGWLRSADINGLRGRFRLTNGLKDLVRVKDELCGYGTLRLLKGDSIVKCFLRLSRHLLVGRQILCGSIS